MKKLIKLNIIMWLIVYIIPTVVKTVPVVANLYEETISVIIGEEEQAVSSRSGTTRIDELHISEDGLALLKQCENCDEVAKKYPGEQYYTYGFGHYGADVKKGQTITRDEADKLLRFDMANEYENLVKKNYDYLELTQNEFDALCIFAYNVSPKSVKQLSGNKTRNKQEIMDHITSYTKSGSERNRKGLLKRRLIEKRVFEKGDYTYEEIK